MPIATGIILEKAIYAFCGKEYEELRKRVEKGEVLEL